MDRWKTRVLPADVVAGWERDTFWDDRTLGELLDTALLAHADVTFSIHSATRPWTGTFADVRRRAHCVAGALRERGVGPHSAVAFQLPNCVEAAISLYAVALLGATVVPIVHFYGPKEVSYILRRTQVNVLITMDAFGPIDFLANLDRMPDALAEIDLVTIVGNDTRDFVPFAELERGDPIDEPAAVDPSAPALVAYTSGTTADPKGVIHSHQTIGAEIRQVAATQPAGKPPSLSGAPVGHAIGMLSSLLLPVVNGEPVHIIDAWDPAAVLRIMREHHVRAGSGSTFFLQSLLDHPDITPEHLELMRWTGLGGAPVPNAIVDRAHRAGLSIVRMYGSTEHPSVTGGVEADAEELRSFSDGHALPGVELRLIDDDGNDVGPGEAGEILSRGPDCCIGYTDEVLTAQTFDADGWYHSGDIGILDDGGWLRITDRKKDIIIRGGENVSAAEVEELLLTIPGVAEAVVVAGPDPRFGERVCAFLRMQPNNDLPELELIRTTLAERGLARQKWPEEVHLGDDLPRTPTGKVQKAVLRDRLRAADAAS